MMNNKSEETKIQTFVNWVEGNLEGNEAPQVEAANAAKSVSFFKREAKRIYAVLSVVLSVIIIAILLVVVNEAPRYGSVEGNPTLNEVSDRYVSKGSEETGAVNTVAGLILDYRAFDTFGEATMLFTAAMATVVLLQKSLDEEEEE